MTKELLKKSIEVHAPREKVWEVMLQDRYTRIWYAAFHEGTYADTTWEKGTRAAFMDSTGSGIVGEITEHLPNEELTITYTGVLTKGREDRESKEAQEWIGSTETYRVAESDGVSTLTVELEGPEKFILSCDPLWERALRKIKELAESNE